MPYPLIGLVGAKRVGKDTYAGALIAHRGFTRVAFADPLRDMALRLDPIVDWTRGFTEEPVRLSEVVESYGWEAVKDAYPEARRTLERLGTDAIRTVVPTFWIDAARAQIEARTTPVVVTDVRYPNEADTIRELGGKLVRIVRPGVERSAHVADNSLDDYEVDVERYNVGTRAELELAALDDVDYLTK